MQLPSSQSREGHCTMGSAKKPAMAGVNSKAEREADLVMGVSLYKLLRRCALPHQLLA